MIKKITDTLNGNIKPYVRFVVIALIVGFGAFLFNHAVKTHLVFATKQEVGTIQSRMYDRLDRIESKVDYINRFLRKK